MDITFTTTPKLEALRQEVREFLEAELPEEYRGFQWDFEEDPDRWTFMRQFWKKLGEKGWLEPTWPTEYGGLAYSEREARIIREEKNRVRAGDLAGIGMAVAPALFRLGTDEQKAFFLPGMARGEIMWGEGYTEPGAGSDLASLRTTAVLDGDEWVINGQKTFTTAGHHCNWFIIAARTDPNAEKNHAGISYFMTPLPTPGLTFTPLHNLGSGRQNHTFLDNVRVPKDRMLGDLNKGWYQIWFGQGGNPIPRFETEDPDPETEYEPKFAGPAFWAFEMLVDYCKQTKRNGRPMSQDPVVREKLAEMEMHIDVLKMLTYEGRCPYGMHMHQGIMKEHQAKFAQECMEILGPLAQIQTGKWAPLAGEIDRIYRRSFGNHAGGTSQLKRMVVATRALGLPR